jgi:hypothetical protein
VLEYYTIERHSFSMHLCTYFDRWLIILQQSPSHVDSF